MLERVLVTDTLPQTEGEAETVKEVLGEVVTETQLLEDWELEVEGQDVALSVTIPELQLVAL